MVQHEKKKIEASKRLLPEEVSNPEVSKKEIDFKYLLARQYCKNCVVLDVGCGVAYGSGLLASSANKVLGTDYSKEAIEYSRTNYANAKVSLLVMDMRNLGFKIDVFDVVVAIEVFEHIRESHLFIGEVKRVLKKDGKFIMSTPNRVFHKKDEIGLKYKAPFHINLVSFRELRKILNCHFGDLKILGIRSKHSSFYNFLRTVDLLNIRLFLKEKQRKLAKQSLFIHYESSTEEFELKPVHYWNIHTFHGFFAICR